MCAKEDDQAGIMCFIDCRKVMRVSNVLQLKWQLITAVQLMLAETCSRQALVTADIRQAAELDDFMAAKETFSSTTALQQAITKDVEQRIATAHLRPVPSRPASIRLHGSSFAPGAQRPTLAHVRGKNVPKRPIHLVNSAFLH